MADITSKEHMFNEWWNADNVIINNPYKEFSPGYWAWEGWCIGYDAGVQEGIKREHAMWQLARIDQDMQLGITYEEANPPEPNCYGDGNVYRGMRSKDSETKIIYLEQQKKEWVGLSPAEITQIGLDCYSLQQTADAIEAKLKEKNCDK